MYIQYGCALCIASSPHRTARKLKRDFYILHLFVWFLAAAASIWSIILDPELRVSKRGHSAFTVYGLTPCARPSFLVQHALVGQRVSIMILTPPA